jgi:hypothetical protein
MKAKLIREVRKRYVIYKYLNGINAGYFINTKELVYVLKHDGEILSYCEQINGRFHLNGKIVSDKEVIIYLKNEILRYVLFNYANKGVRRIRHQQIREKIYYKND